MKLNKDQAAATPASDRGQPALSAQPGELAPAFEGQPLSGRASVRLEDYRGKVVYLDFWASWCAACRRSLPWLERLHREHAAAGFEVVSVSVDFEPADARAFLEQNPVGYPVVDDSAGSIAVLYDVQDLPSSYLIDRNGVLRSTHRGFQPGDEPRLRSAIAELLREP